MPPTGRETGFFIRAKSSDVWPPPSRKDRQDHALPSILEPLGPVAVSAAVTTVVGRIWRGLTDRSEKSSCFALAATGLFCVALSLVHYNHELWRDEIHCWSVGRNAAGLWDLLTGIRRYDGHPFLWYYVLYLVSRWSRSEVYLHVVTIVLATLSAYLWLRHGNLPRVLRLMLLGTYCFFFEYGVLSRSYALGVFLALLFCRLYDPRQLRIFRLFVVLVLLSFTSIYGCIMTAALGGFLSWQSVGKLRSALLARRHKRKLYWQWLLGIALVGFALYVHLKTSLPPADAFYSTTAAKRPDLFSSSGFGKQFWSALFPWNSRNDGTWIVSGFIGERSPWFKQNLLPFAGAVFLLWLLALRKVPAAAFALFLGVAAMAYFQAHQYTGYFRHWGHFFVLLILSTWLFAKHDPPRPVLLYCLAAITMAFQIATNVRAVKTEIDLPFSGAQEAANYLRAQHLDNEPILATYDHAASSIAGYLDRKFLWAETGTESQTVVFRKDRYDFPAERDILVWAQATVRDLGRPVLLILNFDLRESLPTLNADLLYLTKPSLRADETFAIYRLSLQTTPP